MAKVYVSSTIVDLKQERQAVLDWLRGARHQAVDSYLPDSETVRNSCLEDVGVCDLYVLILGHRYGFQPPDDNSEGLSITQLEFRRAGECGIPRIALVRTSIPDVGLSDLADPQRLALVSVFRAEVADRVRAVEFSDLQGLIQGLSTGVLAALEKLGKRPDGSQAGGPVLRLPPRLPFLAGREELLAELDDRLADREGAGPRVAALTGMGGAGKTSVAVEYAHRHLGEVGVAWRLPAEDTTVLAAGFAELAGQLGEGGSAEGGDPVAAVHSALAAYPGKWLLIFDNAPEQAAVRDFLPPAGNGRVLITSQSAIWSAGQAVQVPVLGTEIAAVYLVNRTGDPDSQAAAALATELGGLPLALEQAAAYIQAATTTLAGYLALFRDRRADLLARGETPEHPADVAATLGLALSRLEARAPAAAGLLRLLACLAPEPVPLSLLLAGAQAAARRDPDVVATAGTLLGDPVAAGDAVAALRRYSLITPAGDGLVLVHRLVQAITLDLTPADTRWRWEQVAAALVEAAVPADPRLPAAWPVCAVLLPHARAVLGLTSDGMRQIARYLGHSGSYPAARDLFRLIADALGEAAAYGPEHSATLNARHRRAHWTGDAGDAAGARDQYVALLPIMERVLGSEHPETLTARGNLAHWTGEAGDAAGARDRYAALLPIRERVSGPEHPATLETRRSLARWTGEAGDSAGARDQYAALLPIYERVQGPEDPGTLITRNNLAHWTGEAGDTAGARDQLAALLPLRGRVLGAKHPDTLGTRSHLARWTGEAGDAAGARDQYAALLPIEERVLGAKHPATLTTRHDLANWTGEAGDAAGARDQYAELLPLRERVLGPEHPATLTTRGGLAAMTGEAGDAAGARDQLAALLPLRGRVLDAKHPATLRTRGALAYWTGKAGDAAGARDQFAALLPLRGRVLGPEHPATLRTRGNLAYWTGTAGDAAGARDRFAELLRIQVRVSGPEHPDTLTTRHNLAHWTGTAGDAAGARDQFAELLPLRERVLGPEHPDTLTTRRNLASWTGQAEDGLSPRED
jgi:Domain of unknown function (DUF4062)/Tetratricopeptide repeat